MSVLCRNYDSVLCCVVAVVCFWMFRMIINVSREMSNGKYGLVEPFLTKSKKCGHVSVYFLALF